MTLNRDLIYFIVNCLLPEYRYCRLNFIQQILEGKKKCYFRHEVRDHKIKKEWPELAVSNIWPLIKNNKKVLKYLPSDTMEHGRWPDRIFFWKVLCTKLPKYADKFLDQVME